MPQFRDPFYHEVFEHMELAPNDVLKTRKATQPTRKDKRHQVPMCIENISVMNENSANVIVDLGFMIGSHIIWSRTITCATAGYWYWAHPHYTLLSDYQVVARFRVTGNNGGGCVGDAVHMHVTGYYLQDYESP